MNITRKDSLSTVESAEVIALFVRGTESSSHWAEQFGAHVKEAIKDAVSSEQAVSFYTDTSDHGRLVVVAIKDKTLEQHRLSGAKAAVFVGAHKLSRVALLSDEQAAIASVLEGFLLGGYRYTRYKTKADDQWAGPESVDVVASDELSDAIETARVFAESTNLARDLVNRSPDETSPQELGVLTKEAGEAVGLSVDVWSKSQIEEEGMGGLLAVNRGSVDPPAFIVLEHKPENPVNAQPIVLVGKAVTFDTGGLSLKPTKDSMDHMKMDMSGGAAVIGATVAAGRLNLPLHIITLVPSTDNRPGQLAYVPGDVIRMHSGATVEVLNTDAEGRMILADALSYAQRFKPLLVVDVATLTGAQVVALGSRVAAIMTNEDERSSERISMMKAAAGITGDLVAELPAFAFYKEQLESDVADLKNVGGREAGSITAGKFLEHFTADKEGNAYPWIHIDIAGPAYGHTEMGYNPKGATGFGVRLLAQMLRSLAD